MPPTAADPHRADVEAWREERYRRLREPMSWLTLVGLDWLREGENRLGSAREAELRLPSGPAMAGLLVRTGMEVTAHGERGAGLTHDGGEVNDLRLVSDADAAEGEEPTLLELAALRILLIRRGGRVGLRIWDTAAPARRDFAGIPHYPVDPAWRIDARFETAAPGETFSVPDVLGDVADEPLLGRVAFELGGVTHRIKAMEGDDDRLWLVFGDATNGDTTYGGGRFLYADQPASDGTVVVDFNRTYNPPCVFSPYATCPLPPAENQLSIRIEAGERLLDED